jgi:hypothetical protein
MAHPNAKSFKVYAVCRVDFDNKIYDHIRFFKTPRDAELLRDDLSLKHVDEEGVMFVVEYCDRSHVD